MKIRNYVKPSSLEEAYEFVASGGSVIGGGAWLKLMPKTIENAVDISGLDLEGIRVVDGTLHIGGMTNLRTIEIDEALKAYMGGLICEAAGNIMGVPLRNIATIGGSVVSRFGFSDLITPLLAVNASLRFFHHGTLTLEAYLDQPFKDKDILIEVILPSQEGVGVYKTLKKTSTDFPMINAAVTKNKQGYRVCVGARPGVAHLATKTMALLNASQAPTLSMVEGLGQELAFGTNSSATAQYREAVAQVLVERCLMEVMA